jgi:hypothetical protein
MPETTRLHLASCCWSAEPRVELSADIAFRFRLPRDYSIALLACDEQLHQLGRDATCHIAMRLRQLHPKAFDSVLEPSKPVLVHEYTKRLAVVVVSSWEWVVILLLEHFASTISSRWEHTRLSNTTARTVSGQLEAQYAETAANLARLPQYPY